jgi:hypothetical protein
VGARARGQVATALIAVVSASLLLALGRTAWVLPLLGGAAWGMLNFAGTERVLAHLRPDRPRRVRWILVDFLLKFPVMYLAAFLLLRGRSRETILAAAGGFALVLLTVVLRSLGCLLRGESPWGARSPQRG